MKIVCDVESVELYVMILNIFVYVIGELGCNSQIYVGLRVVYVEFCRCMC
jgi:hypothetical protein